MGKRKVLRQNKQDLRFLANRLDDIAAELSACGELYQRTRGLRDFCVRLRCLSGMVEGAAQNTRDIADEVTVADLAPKQGDERITYAGKLHRAIRACTTASAAISRNGEKAANTESTNEGVEVPPG